MAFNWYSQLYRCLLNSSFVLPTNYAIDKINIKKIDDELNSFNTIHKIHKSIADDKREIRETKNKVDKSDKRNIEILGIFSAIVLFATGSVHLFPFIKSTSAALHFMLVFSFSLCTFVLAIWLITRESEVRKMDFPILHKAFLFIFFIVTVWMCYTTNKFSDPELSRITESIKTDSIKISTLKTQHKNDSVKIDLLNTKVDNLIKKLPKNH